MQNRSQAGLLSSHYISRNAPAIWLTIAYLIISILWILFSDSLAAKMAGGNGIFLQKIQGMKGLFYVSFSSLFLFFFSRRLYSDVRSSLQQKNSVEEKFRALNEAAREGIFDYDIKRDRAVLNKKMKFFFPSEGLQVDGFWQKYDNRIHPEDKERVIIELNGVINDEGDMFQTALRLKGKDNVYYYVIANTYVIRDSRTGAPIRLIGAVQDISEIRRLQEENMQQQLRHKKSLAASIIRAQENERNRWSGELHDNVCQILSVANMYAGEIASHPDKANLMAPQLKKLVADSIAEIRQLSVHMKPPSFSDTTLVDSLHELCANINRVNSIEFVFDINQFREKRLCGEQKLMIYRVVQEQLNNIIKYAGAEKVVITLSVHHDEVNVVIEDDGKGFDPSSVTTGLGLRNIQGRLQVYNGTMNIQSEPGKGCILSASFSIALTNK